MHARREIAAAPSFDSVCERDGQVPLVRGRTTTLQVNMGKRCNQACLHCHVAAGPERTETMSEAVVRRVVELLAATADIDTVDITGGAPELNAHFRWLVEQSRHLDRRVIDRCNLTVLLEPDRADLPEFLAANRVDVVASLPCYGAENVDRQRGSGVFAKSLAALRRLNALGYGMPNSPLALDVVYNPLGAFLPPPQAKLEAQYKEELRRRYGIEFRRLLTITNMPINRFADSLDRCGQYDKYFSLLVDQFNPATVPGLMCRTLLSVGWDGRLYDCDFNQMLEIPWGGALAGRRDDDGARPAADDVSAKGPPRTVWDLGSFQGLDGLSIATGPHCFGCTAGAGSGCTGSLA